MPRTKKKGGAHGHHRDTISDDVSELSHDSSLDSNISKKSGLRGTISRLTRHSRATKDPTPPRQRDVPPKTQAKPAGHAAKSPPIDKKKLMKDAKSRFNIGTVYLKTGDYAKAQENLESALFSYVTAWGHDARAYSNDEILAVAGVREKLGDCLLANPAIADKHMARDHYEESYRLLRKVDPEDASDEIAEMLKRVEETLERPEVSGARKRPPTFLLKKEAIVRVGSGGATVETAEESHLSPPPPTGKKKKCGPGCQAKRATVLAGAVVKAGIHSFIDDSSDEEGGHPEPSATALAHLERGNHRTALNCLKSLREGGATHDHGLRREVADSALKVADAALAEGKIAVATDAYEEAHAALKGDDGAGDGKKRAARGCIKGHKLLAKGMEADRNYGAAISHRTKAFWLLDEEKRTVPACRQRVRIAYLHGEEGEYAKSTLVLSEAIGLLREGVRVKSIDRMATDRRDVLIQCYQMQAICYTKLEKWNDALGQYDEALPLVATKEGNDGRNSKQYNLMLIHKSTLLVTVGKHRLAASTLDEYLKNEKVSQRMAGEILVDGVDHALALDICAATHLKLGKVDEAISIFQEKLTFVKTLPDNNALKCDTMHKLGCLLANRNQHRNALPLLNESLQTKKFVYGGKHRSVLATSWAVAATHHTLGESRKALEEYSALLGKRTNNDDMPVDAVVIGHAVGKLFVEDGKVDKAVPSFRQALDGADASGNDKLKSEITLNLANALSTGGDWEEAMELYDELLNDKSLKKTKLAFTARFNRCLLLIKMGEAEEATRILRKIAKKRSPAADDVRGKVFLTLGNLAASDGNIDEALDYFENALDAVEDGDLGALVHAKRCIAEVQLEAGRVDEAISTLECLLEDLSVSGGETKSANLLQAKTWNSLAIVYKGKNDIHEAKHFAKMALQTYKAELGETNPITLRNVSNLQLLILEEAEDLEQSQAKSIIDAARHELEQVLDAFVSTNNPAYRFDVASLKINLGLVAVWQEKPKKARKLLQQVEGLEVPPDHSLANRVAVLEECVEKLEEQNGAAGAAFDTSPKGSQNNKKSTKENRQTPKKSKKGKGESKSSKRR